MVLAPGAASGPFCARKKQSPSGEGLAVAKALPKQGTVAAGCCRSPLAEARTLDLPSRRLMRDLDIRGFTPGDAVSISRATRFI